MWAYLKEKEDLTIKYNDIRKTVLLSYRVEDISVNLLGVIFGQVKVRKFAQ